jgi:hypothetical protein
MVPSRRSWKNRCSGFLRFCEWIPFVGRIANPPDWNTIPTYEREMQGDKTMSDYPQNEELAIDRREETLTTQHDGYEATDGLACSR